MILNKSLIMSFYPRTPPFTVAENIAAVVVFPFMLAVFIVSQLTPRSKGVGR